MMNENKIILYGDLARKSIYDGMHAVYKAVSSTMGPSGRNVMIENQLAQPMATKDGVTVANYIKLSDKKQDMGAQLLKNVSRTTADTSGDGTTTSTVLAYNLLKNGLNELQTNDKINLIDFKRGMDKATKDVVNLLKDKSHVCKTKEDIYKIAMISSNGDEEISELVTEAVYKSKIENEDGSIEVKTSTTFESDVEFNDAMVVGSGYGKYYQFVNDNKTLTANHDNVRVLVFDGSLGTLSPSIKSIMSQCYVNNEALLIVANEFSPNFVLNFVQNLNNGLRSILITSPEFGSYQKMVMNDIAIATNTRVLGNDGLGGADLVNLKMSDLGYAKNVISTEKKTFIKIGVEPSQFANDSSPEEAKYKADAINEKITNSISDYIEGIKGSVENMKSVYEKNQAKARISNLSSIKSTINLYGTTEVELEEKKQRAEDAVFATSSAIEEGFVIGSGVTLAKISKNLENEEIEGNESFKLGYKNVINSIKSPLIQIYKNAYLYPKNVVSENYNKDGLKGIEVDLEEDSLKGFDVRSMKHVDNMIESGIIDPTKVIRCALENANSISSVTLTTECLIFSDGYYSEELSSKENHYLMYGED